MPSSRDNRTRLRDEITVLTFPYVANAARYVSAAVLAGGELNTWNINGADAGGGGLRVLHAGVHPYLATLKGGS